MADQKSFSESLFRYLDWLKVICVVGAVASILAVNVGMTAANQGIMIFLSGLAGVFFLNAYKPPIEAQSGEVQSGEKKDFATMISQTILPKVLWISCAVGTIGLLFYLLKMEGAQQMLMIGTATSAAGVALFAGLSLVNSKATQPLSPVLYRAVPIMLITGYFLYAIIA